MTIWGSLQPHILGPRVSELLWGGEMMSVWRRKSKGGPLGAVAHGGKGTDAITRLAGRCGGSVLATHLGLVLQGVSL